MLQTETVNASELALFGIRTPKFYTQVDKKYRTQAKRMSEKKRSAFIGRIPGGFMDYMSKQLDMRVDYQNPLVLSACALAFKKQYIKYIEIEIQLATQENKYLLNLMEKL